MKDKLQQLLEKLINDAKDMLTDTVLERAGTSVTEIPHLKKDKVRKWANELTLFTSIAGDLVKPWSNKLCHDARAREPYSVEEPLAALEVIKSAMDEGLLVRFRDLILAEAFADLNEQAKYLLSNNFILAAAVIFRAVLEEKLRNLCDKHKCMPQKQRPTTIEDYNMALYTRTPPIYGKSMMQNVTALAGIGNDAAHNKPSLKAEDVKRLQAGIEDFLVRFSV